MRSTTLVICLLATAASCSKKKEDGPSPSSSTTNPTEPSAKPADVGAASKRLYKAMTCEEILPQAIKDKYFGGQTPKDDTNGSNSAGCKFEGTAGPLTFAAACLADVPAGTFGHLVTAAKERTTGDFKSVPDIGKHVMYGQVGNTSEEGGNHSITIFDDDSDCEIMATIPANHDVATFAKEAAAAFPIR